MLFLNNFRPSFAGYFASRGGAVSLPVGRETRTATKSHIKTCGMIISCIHHRNFVFAVFIRIFGREVVSIIALGFIKLFILIEKR